MAAVCVCPWGGRRLLFLRSVTEPFEQLFAMAGVFDIDLDQPEENVSDDENEEVRKWKLSSVNTEAVAAENS